ncbi:MAG: hypothetical protein EOO88_07975, partial [Pedobacter sp.]
MEFLSRSHQGSKSNDMKRNIYLIMLFLSLAGFRNSSSRKIEGLVYSKDDGNALAGVMVTVKGGSLTTKTDQNGHYALITELKNITLVFTSLGFERQEVTVGKSNKINVSLVTSSTALQEIRVVGYQAQQKSMPAALSGKVAGMGIYGNYQGRISMRPNTDSYKGISENIFNDPKTTPLSTFAIDVDAASYSNVRRFINNGALPPKDAVRIEEMINYFRYDLSGPSNQSPVAIHTELSSAPWNPQHRLLRIGLKAKSINTEKLPPANFVFLIDGDFTSPSNNISVLFIFWDLDEFLLHYF